MSLSKINRLLYILLCLIPVLIFAQPLPLPLPEHPKVKWGNSSKWIHDLSIDDWCPPVHSSQTNIQHLLLDKQTNLATKETYYRCVYRLLDKLGTQENAKIEIVFDPAYETLSFHTIMIHRDGKAIFSTLLKTTASITERKGFR